VKIVRSLNVEEMFTQLSPIMLHVADDIKLMSYHYYVLYN